MYRRLAPSDMRMESFFQPRQRAHEKQITRFAQVITNMHSAAPHSVSSSRRDCVVSSSRKETMFASTFSFSLGYCCRKRSDQAHLSLRLFQRDTGLQPADADNVVIVALLVRVFIESEGRPELRFPVGEVKVGRHDANDCVRLPIEKDRLPQNAGIAAELVLPKCIAQNDGSRSARGIVMFSKASPH